MRHAACSSTRSASRAAASGRPSPRAARRHRVEAIGRGEELGHDRVEPRRVALRVGHDDGRAAPARASARCGPGGRSARPASGTSTAGTPAAVSSATVPAPARHTASVARASSASMCGSYADQLVRERVAGPALRVERGRALRFVAGPAHVVDGDIRAVAPAVVAAERRAG